MASAQRRSSAPRPWRLRGGGRATLIAWYWLPVVAWMAVILALSGRSDFPARTNPTTGEVVRTTYTLAKMAHVVEYGVLALLLFRATTAPAGGLGAPPARAAIWVVAASTAFGLGDELRQSFVPNREPRLTDVLIDGLSALVTIAIVLVWRWARPAQRLGRRVLG